jgi:GntR family transcriptional regulator
LQNGDFSMKNGSIDRSSPIPYYIQLKEALREKIDHGEWKPGDQIPSEPDLCELFDVSRTVIRQALKDMEYEGLIVREKGKGTFVAEPKINESLVQNLTGFYQDMEDRGYETVSQVLKQEVVHASAKVARYLNLEAGALVIEIQRVRYIQEEPIVMVTTFLPYGRCAKLLQAKLEHQSLYRFIEEECGLYISRGRRFIEAVAANEMEAQHLQVEKGAPMILLNSVSFLSDGTPIEYYHAVHRGDRSRFEVELVRVREHGKAKEISNIEVIGLPSGNDILK